MPYATTKQLPAEVKQRYGARQQRAFLAAFNDALRRGQTEEAAFRVAHAAARRAGDAPPRRTKSSLVTEARLRERYGRPEAAKTYTAEERRKLEKTGGAMAGGKFPINDCADVRAAVSRLGQQKGVSDAAVKAHITRRAKALGCAGSLPDSWTRQSSERAFVTQVENKTIITAPTGLTLPGVEFAVDDSNEHFLWLQGAFVGAEQANANGALWSLGDLELGEPSVRHGPLNWLHEGRRVVGAIAQTRLVRPGTEQAALGERPYIAALSAVWRWLYPHEAHAVEQAAAENTLWYSMECISRQVACADHGCGQWPYKAAIAAADDVCEHVAQRTGTRRFVEPTFLGGAVILPPVKPGWADAHAGLLRQAASLAPAAYEQAQPGMSSGEWEQLVAQVLAFAGV